MDRLYATGTLSLRQISNDYFCTSFWLYTIVECSALTCAWNVPKIPLNRVRAQGASVIPLNVLFHMVPVSIFPSGGGGIPDDDDEDEDEKDKKDEGKDDKKKK